jgi:hypothetical protein
MSDSYAQEVDVRMWANIERQREHEEREWERIRAQGLLTPTPVW